MFREKWKNSTYWRHDLGFCKPLQIFLHQLFPLTKLISFYKTFISLQTLVRKNWYLILRQRYVWYCIVLHRLHTNNTSKNYSNVEWSKTIQNLAMSWVNLFLEFHHSESFPSIFKDLPLGLSCFKLYHPIVLLSLLTLRLLALIIHKLGLGNKGKGESTLVKSKAT